MRTDDVHHRLLLAPLAVYDDDIEDHKDLTRTEKLLPMNRLSTRSVENTQRFSHRKSSSTIVTKPASELIKEYPDARKVRIRLVFIHIGDIDTLNEKYQADIYFEARWIEKQMTLKTLNLTPQQQTQLLGSSIVKITELNPAIPWSPHLYIENAIGQIGEQNIWFTIKKIQSELGSLSSSLPVNVEICEHRRINGIFWEKLELKHFPADVQDLTISIISHHQIENCLLVQDDKFSSFINREAFVDQQEWFLYEHVATEERRTKEEYSFEDDDSGIEQKNHSVLAVTCRAARRPGYYYWNGFCLIFLITVCSFCIFSITPDLSQNRLQITSTLLLTSVTFRWVVNRSLPQISYLTILDIYALISIIILVVLCIWHSIIASVIFYNSKPIGVLRPDNIYVAVDRFVFISLFTIYIVIHIALIIWLIFVPYNRRREMERLDREYIRKKNIQINTRQSKYGPKKDLGFTHSLAGFEIFPSVKPVRPMRQSDGVVIMPNASAFTPIQEASNEEIKKPTDMIEIHDPHDIQSNHVTHTEQP